MWQQKSLKIVSSFYIYQSSLLYQFDGFLSSWNFYICLVGTVIYIYNFTYNPVTVFHSIWYWNQVLRIKLPIILTSLITALIFFVNCILHINTKVIQSTQSTQCHNKWRNCNQRYIQGSPQDSLEVYKYTKSLLNCVSQSRQVKNIQYRCFCLQ